MGQYKCDRCGRRIWVDAGDVRLCHSCEEQLKEETHELRTENEDYSIKTSGFYYYDAGTTNAPQSSRGGMIIANYLSDSWISLIVVPYASSKIYTNTKYNNTWVGWAESATKNDFVIKTYTIAGKAVNAETIADFEPNIALSGYTPLGIVGTRLNAYGSVTLVYADLVDDTKARVRVRNNGTESVTGDNVIIRVLYFKS